MKKRSFIGLILQVLVVVVFIMCLYLFTHDNQVKQVSQSFTSSTSSTSSVVASSKSSSQSSQNQKIDLPDVSSSDWELVLVNRNNIKEEMNPELAEVEGVQVDARIAENVTNFLAAARAIEPNEKLISGYRSVAYQQELYNSYVQQEIANDPSLIQEAAEEKVQTYSQPPGASEHQTGLAIDMSNVNSLNESNAEIVSQIKVIAPEYGFVLRFESDKQDSTGIGYEDWHYRYVGVESAKYMTEHNLSLEEYLNVLKENGK